FLRCSADIRHLPSFPTRRSSDLGGPERLLALRVDVVGLAVDRDRLALEGERARVARAVAGDDRPVAGLGRPGAEARALRHDRRRDRKSTRLNSSHVKISYAVFCL